MNLARYDFNACEYHSHVYLCGDGSGAIEAFNPASNCFLPFQAQVPKDGRCLLLVENQELVVMSMLYVTRWKAGQDHHLVRVSQKVHLPVNVWSQMAPVVDSVNGVAFTVWGGTVYCVKLDGSERRELDK